MAIIPIFRVIIFTLITLFSLVVLGICAHIEYLLAGYTDPKLSFVPLALATGGLTVLSLPLFLVLGILPHRIFTSMILFEIIWFFILWALWVGTAGDTVAGTGYFFPIGCVSDIYSDPTITQVCYEFTVVEAFAFLNFACAFIYYDVIFLYAIINGVRGRDIWTASVKEATTATPGAANPGAPIVQSQFNAAPATQYQNYGAYPPNAPPTQPYNAYPQQVPPQGPSAQPYNAYPQQAPPHGPPTIPPGQHQPYNYPPSPGAPQQQPNYNSYPAHGSQAQLPLPSGYQGQPNPQQQQHLPSQSPYGPHQPISV